MNTRQTLLAALHHEPDDETGWLALADCLEEEGDPAHAELLRLHRRVRQSPDDPAVRGGVERIRQLLLEGVRPVVPVLVNSLKMPLALIPPGVFLMGTSGGDRREIPQHEVEISQPFYLGVYPVTQDEYRLLTGTNPSAFARSSDQPKELLRTLDTGRFPVERVSWRMARAFCQALSELPAEKEAGHVYRLPTEAEWEYACRGGLGASPYYLGEVLHSQYANFRGSQPHNAEQGPNLERTTDVGTYPPNPYGLFDLYGQVWEWCNDHFERDYYQRSPRLDPPGPTTGEGYVQRGGCWAAIGSCCRSAYRTRDGENAQQYSFGFRVAMTRKK